MKKLACLILALAASGCPDIKTDTNETSAEPVVEFDPSNRIVPFPNNLLIDPATGKVNLPAQCNESVSSKSLRENVLNKLDGFGLFKTALTVTFSTPFVESSLAGRVVLYKRATAGVPVDPATATPIPVVTLPADTVRFDANCGSPTVVAQLLIVPMVPLEQKSSYVVALLDGITSNAEGNPPFAPSLTWRLVRSAHNPVTIENGVVVEDDTPLDPANPADRERLEGINLLWNAHALAVKFLADDLPADKRVERDKLLLAWEFRTQTVTDTLDASVAGSPASTVDKVSGLVGNISPPIQDFATVRQNPPFNQCPGSDSDTQCFLKISVGGGNYAVGNATCAAIRCAAIAEVVGSTLSSKQYQIDTPNAYTGPGAKPIPGPWTDPNHPSEVRPEAIQVITTIPNPAIAPMPATGYPVVVFQHGITRSKNDVLAVAGGLAAIGFATVAIDAVAHGSRAVRVSTNAAIGCANAAVCSRPDCGPEPTAFPQCYAPFLSPNLGATRDGIRQTVLDQQRLVAAIRVCGTTNCGPAKLDADHIVYAGMSLGGIIGGITAASTPEIKASVLNVAAVSWVDILENTGTLPLQCSLVDGLIDAGILTGEKSNLAVNPPTGLCTTPAWKAQPGYRQFSVIGRWILDAADPVSFTRKLATRKFLLQEVVADSVIPNVATAIEGALTGLTPMMADLCGAPCTQPNPPPSLAIITNPTANKWIRYGGAAGNTFAHGSLLQPATNDTAGQLGTARLQIDAGAYLSINK